MTEITEPQGRAIAAPQDFRPGLGGRLGVSLVTLFLGALALAEAVLAIAVARETALPVTAMVAFSSLVIAALTVHVGAEAIARWRLKARLENGRIVAQLPAKRGFIADEPVRLDLALDDIDRIETRLEAFSGMGTTTAQRAYALRMKNGDLIALGADRDMTQSFFFGSLAKAIAAQSGAEIADLGMVEGKSGFLLVAGQSAPAWGEAALSPERTAIIERRRALTPLILGAMVTVIFVVRLFFGG